MERIVYVPPELKHLVEESSKVKARITVTHPVMDQFLREVSGKRPEKALRKVEDAMRKGEKPLAFIPVRDMYEKVARSIYEKLKDHPELGKKIRALYVGGGILTPNVHGVSTKLQRAKTRTSWNIEKDVQKEMRGGIIEDFDLFILTDPDTSKEERDEIDRIVRETMREHGVPDDLLDDSYNYIIPLSDRENLARAVHRMLPKLFFDKEHYNFVMRLAEELARDEMTRRIMEEEEKYYRNKVKIYYEKRDEELRDLFLKTLERFKKGNIDLSPEERAIAERLEETLYLYDSPFWRNTLERLILEGHEKLRDLNVPERRDLIRKALARVIRTYMEWSMKVHRGGMKDVFDKIEGVRRYKETVSLKKRKGVVRE